MLQHDHATISSEQLTIENTGEAKSQAILKNGPILYPSMYSTFCWNLLIPGIWKEAKNHDKMKEMKNYIITVEIMNIYQPAFETFWLSCTICDKFKKEVICLYLRDSFVRQYGQYSNLNLENFQ